MNSHREHRDIEKLMDTLVTEPDNTKFQEKIRTKIE
jgi:hypothetical protein